MGTKIAGLCFIILGIQILITQEFNNNRGMLVNLSTNYLYFIVGLGLVIYGFLLIYSALKNDKNMQKKQEYSICPNCKEAFLYSELDNGKCKYCEDIDTIDTEEYYKDNPEKDEDK
jgi:uncharacterized membrane protein